eukprot:SAG11_NODE_16_length_26235_cov_39.900417_3_plen_145_part_00
MLQSTQEGGENVMGEFKKSLEEMVERSTMEMDYATFAQLCFECSIGADPNLPKGKATAVVPIDEIAKLYRRTRDPNREAEGELRTPRSFCPRKSVFRIWCCNCTSCFLRSMHDGGRLGGAHDQGDGLHHYRAPDRRNALRARLG